MPLTYPVELELVGRSVVVVGGGAVAARKVAGLCEAGARVYVVAPSFEPELRERGDCELVEREYASEVLDSAELVFACTNRREVNARVAADAQARGIWCNVADDPEESNFFVPASLRSGQFTIAVGTGGAAPLLAAAVRDLLACQFGPEFGILVDELARARPIVHKCVLQPEMRRQIFETLCGDESIRLLVDDGREAWRAWFDRVLEGRLHGEKR